MKILQINTTFKGGGSTGRIVADLFELMTKEGEDAYAVYGYETVKVESDKLYQVQNRFERKISILQTRIFGKHGFYNIRSTRKLVDWIDEVNPDIVHLHNLHNHYINIQILFDYIKKKNIAVVWTLHDCWAFTGWCAYFDYYGCNKWIEGCNHCPAKHDYPKTWFFDRSEELYKKKANIFVGVRNMYIVTPSKWLAELAKKSMLGDYSIQTINNGVDVYVFEPKDYRTIIRQKYSIGEDKKMILSVASRFTRRKGIEFIKKIPEKLDEDCILVVVGVDEKNKEELSGKAICISRTENVNQLAELYSAADVFINPTLEDNFPTTNLEALACGTPIITYNTGGSPEAVDSDSGVVIEKGDEEAFIDAINKSLKKSQAPEIIVKCRNRATQYFEKKACYMKYINLYRDVYREMSTMKANACAVSGIMEERR